MVAEGAQAIGRGDDTNTIFTALEDTQMATQLYSTCVLQRSPFHAAADVLHNINTVQPLNPFQ
eukprot:1380570-Ditylum_brightwellii.AAC.1